MTAEVRIIEVRSGWWRNNVVIEAIANCQVTKYHLTGEYSHVRSLRKGDRRVVTLSKTSCTFVAGEIVEAKRVL
jgi:hypothetical protein